MIDKRLALFFAVFITLGSLSCGKGSSEDEAGDQDTAESDTDTLLNLNQLSDLPLPYFANFDVREGSLSSTSKTAYRTRDQAEGEISIGACAYDTLFNEATRQSAIEAAYACSLTTAESLSTELEIGNDKYAYYRLTIPALSTGESLGLTSELLLRVGRFDDVTVTRDVCLNGALVSAYSVTVDAEAKSLSGAVTTKAETESFSEMSTLSFEAQFGNVTPSSGDFSLDDIDSATLSLAFDGESSEGELDLSYDEEGTSTFSGFASLVSPDDGAALEGRLFAFANDEVALAQYEAEGYYPAFTVDQLTALGVSEDALADGTLYCFDADVKELATQIEESGGTCSADNPACYGLIENNDTACDFSLTSGGSAFDTSEDNFPVVDESDTPFGGELSSGLLPDTETISISFANDAWDCTGNFVDIDLSQGNFSACREPLAIAFPDTLIETCMKTIDGESF